MCKGPGAGRPVAGVEEQGDCDVKPPGDYRCGLGRV